MPTTPRLVITLGEPLSINVEAIATLFGEHNALKKQSLKVIVIGSYDVFQRQIVQMPWITPAQNFNVLSSKNLSIETNLPKDDFLFFNIEDTPKTCASQWSDLECGKLSKESLELLSKLPPSQRLCVLTAPVDKKKLYQAGYTLGGQTEYFAKVWQGFSIMLLASQKLKVGLATNHVAIKDLPQKLTEEVVVKKILAFLKTLRHLRPNTHPIEVPLKIAVCGLNPHASDHGMFGNEEERIIAPAIEKAKTLAPYSDVIEGPKSADTIFHFANNGLYDGVLAMYHDQGLAPIKSLYFHETVNITGGLEHLRVSPDHGPARDLFLKGSANLDSFRLAWQHCMNYLAHP